MAINYKYSLLANVHELVNGVDLTSESRLSDNVKAGNITSAFDKVSKIVELVNSKGSNQYFIEYIEPDFCACTDTTED